MPSQIVDAVNLAVSAATSSGVLTVPSTSGIWAEQRGNLSKAGVTTVDIIVVEVLTATTFRARLYTSGGNIAGANLSSFNGAATFNAEAQSVPSEVIITVDAQHGSRGGGALHALATTSTAGFESAADKTKIDEVVDTKSNCRLCTAGVNLIAAGWTVLGSGVGKTITSATSNVSNNTFDGIVGLISNRILVESGVGTGAVHNGIYTITQLADGVNDKTVLTRATDFDSSTEITSGTYTFVEEGNTKLKTGFELVTANPIVLETTQLAFGEIAVVLHTDVLAADPVSPNNGDIWITDVNTIRQLCARLGGITYGALLPAKVQYYKHSDGPVTSILSLFSGLDGNKSGGFTILARVIGVNGNPEILLQPNGDSTTFQRQGLYGAGAVVGAFAGTVNGFSMGSAGNGMNCFMNFTIYARAGYRRMSRSNTAQEIAGPAVQISDYATIWTDDTTTNIIDFDALADVVNGIANNSEFLLIPWQ